MKTINAILILLFVKMFDFVFGILNPQVLFFQENLTLLLLVSVTVHFLIFFSFGLFSLIRERENFTFILNQTVYSVIFIACINFVLMLYMGERDISGISLFFLALFSFFEVVLGLIASLAAYLTNKLVIKK